MRGAVVTGGRDRGGRARSSRLACLALGVLLVACDGDAPDPDAAVPVDAMRIGLHCERDDQCDDARFCNGAERCDPEAPGADARGCLLGDAACAGQRCDEATDACVPCEVGDADGDGHDDVACGGDDCDDTDAERFPGATEVCDALDRDEDCDPTTFGADVDGDGFPSSACCNDVGVVLCGADCDDSSAAIVPGATEVCNGRDEDCDGSLDEGVPHTIFPDDDDDGFGRTQEGRAACTLPADGGWSYLGGDCDDANPSLSPRSAEACNGVDDDCDAGVDEGCPCEPGDARGCGLLDGSGNLVEQGSCHPGDQICRERQWSSCIMATLPEEELCNTVDDDCDGAIDEGQTILQFLDQDGDGVGGEPRAACGVLAGYVALGGDCDDRRPGVSPEATESCNGIDDDCDGDTDEGCTTGCGDGETRACTSECGVGIETCASGTFGGCTAPTPVTETCDGSDEDCDGATDEDLAPPSCPLEMGVCAGSIARCDGGGFICDASDYPSSYEVVEVTCDGLDNDCDGMEDELVGPACPLVDGVCAGSTAHCDGSGFVCDASDYPSTYEAVEATCDGLDNDCDGDEDEALSPPACPLTMGVCASTIAVCEGGAGFACHYPLGTYEATETTCDGLDNDCDGAEDDTLTPPACPLSAGVCAGSTAFCFGSDGFSCATGFGYPSTYESGAETSCDGLDNDCDGPVDEAITRGCSTSCGSGVETCAAGSFGGCTAPTTCQLTPRMTSFTTPTGVVASSGDYDPSYPAWQAFDQTGSLWLSAVSVAPAWISYRFTDGTRTVTEYRVQYNNGSLTSRAPRTWTFEGWNGASWVILDTRSAETGWTSGQVRAFTIASPAAYDTYRLHITNDNDDSQPIVVVSIGELGLYGF